MEEELVRILRPVIADVVRTEVERAQLQWRWRTVKQAAEILELSEQGIYSRIRRGVLPHKRFDGRVYIDMTALDRQLKGSYG